MFPLRLHSLFLTKDFIYRSMGKKQKISDYLKKHLSHSRFTHSLRTAEYAKHLAHIYGVSPKKSYLAGLSHDIARELPDQVLISLVQKDGFPIRDFEKEHPRLLHGRAGAVLLREHFNVKSEKVLEAVRWHTLGHAGVMDICKIVYLADYLEPGRKDVPQAFRRNIEEKEIDEALLEVLDHSFLLYGRKNNEAIEAEINNWIIELETAVGKDI